MVRTWQLSPHLPPDEVETEEREEEEWSGPRLSDNPTHIALAGIFALLGDSSDDIASSTRSCACSQTKLYVADGLSNAGDMGLVGAYALLTLKLTHAL